MVVYDGKRVTKTQFWTQVFVGIRDQIAKRPQVMGAMLLGLVAVVAALWAFMPSLQGQSFSYGSRGQSDEGFVQAVSHMGEVARGVVQSRGLDETPQDSDGSQSDEGSSNRMGPYTPGDQAQVQESGRICVHVAGEVNAAGVYVLMEGARVADAVAAAGGFSSNACADGLNLAREVGDGERVYVPSREEVDASGGVASSPFAGSSAAGIQASGSGQGGSGSGSSGQQTGVSGGLVNLNRADAATLETLPGVGPATAAAIISYRESSGGFASIEDLMQVDGIGEKKFAKVKDLICV
ncbi:MAG: ComEA family DNA-binding protein [Eggerthellales bacterium]|nr:ComEA family DNA-binding protein [Eggerthellales bacterium]